MMYVYKNAKVARIGIGKAFGVYHCGTFVAIGLFAWKIQRKTTRGFRDPNATLKWEKMEAAEVLLNFFRTPERKRGRGSCYLLS
jgi:hypothetical protein